MTEIRGVCPIVAAPFAPSGVLDLDSLANLVRHLAGGACHALALFGIAGEYYKLSDQERCSMVEIMVDECQRAGAFSIISVTQHATELAVREAQCWQDAGADCLMVLPPFFLKPSAGDLCQHVRMIARAVRVPVIIQYAPEQTSVAVSPELLVQLAREADNILFFKIECKPSGAYITRLLELAETAQVFVGNAGFQLVEALDRGAIGVMPGCSLYEVYLRVYEAYVSGRRQEAVRVHNLLLPLLNHIRQDVEMIIFYEKKILHRKGLIASDHCRRPAFTPDCVHEKLFEEYYCAVTDALAGCVRSGGVM